MPFPRSRLPTLTTAVVVAVVLLATLVALDLRRRWSGEASIQIANRTSAPLYGLRLIHANGEQEIARILPGEVVEWRFRPSAAGMIGLQTREKGYTRFRVEPGSQVRLNLKD